MMGVAFIGVVGGLYMFSNWASTNEMAPLFTDLETSDAASISDELNAMGVPYDLADQGHTVLVPRDRVYELRLDMSSAGLPDGGSQGYSLLDEQGITSTQFQQRVAFQRALEGELSTTIRHIDSIEAASVHLVIPRDDLFVGDDIKSTASVLVQTSSTLAPEQVQAIVNLVAGSVEGLRADAVTVADQTGLVLAAPGQTPFDRAGGGGSASETVAFESGLAAEIQNMLVAVVGQGNALVTVSAQMDWDASNTVSEIHTPSAVGEGEDPLMARESTNSETYNTTSASDLAAGTLGGDEDSTNDATAESDYSNTGVDREFVWDSVVTSQENTGGDIEKLNVAVLIDEGSSTAGQIAEIEALVTSAAGLDTARGDTLAVSRLAFDDTIQEAIAAEFEATATAGQSAAAGDMLRTIVLGLLGFLIVVIAAVQLWRGRKGTEEVEELDLATLTNTLTAGAARQAAAGPAVTEAVAARRIVPVEDDSISPNEELQMLVDAQPDEVARLLRTWLADRRAVAR
jgi:flagellar M-ring protein FliF